MKRLIYGSLFLATVGIVILACKKEAMSPMGSIDSAKNKTIDQKQKGEITQSNEKSTGNGGLDSMAQAADMNHIAYVSSSDSYSIKFYNESIQYQATINTFFVDSLIRMTIVEGSNHYNVTIGVQLDTIVISGIGSYNFSNYYDSYGLTARSGDIKNIVAIMVPYYALYPNTTTSWTDNGNTDTFDPASIFWGSVESKRDPCDPILHTQTIYYDDYAFWIRLKHNRPEFGQPC